MSHRRLVALALAAAALLLAPSASAQELAEPGLYVDAELAVRITPAAVRAIVDAGYRAELYDDVEGNILLEGAYVDGGLTTNLTPTSVFGGLFVEALPVQVLRLRADAQVVQYLGTFGYLFTAERRADGEWDLSPLSASHDMGDGDTATGALLRASAEPRIKIGGFVATAETRLAWMTLDRDDPYFEPVYDVVLEPTDAYWTTAPTAGWLFEFGPGDGHLVVGARWEHRRSFDAEMRRDVLLGVALWDLPDDWWASARPRLAVVGGAWLRHPEREGDPFVATQLQLEWPGL